MATIDGASNQLNVIKIPIYLIGSSEQLDVAARWLLYQGMIAIDENQ